MKITSTRMEEEVDASVMVPISPLSIVLTGVSVVLRFISIIINWSLAYDYWLEGSYSYTAWTIGSILLPMVITSAVYTNVLSASNSDQRGMYSTVVLSYLFRDGYALHYALEYSKAQTQGHKELEIKYYQQMLREECDVGFIRLFDSFLESAPQKILQLVILMRSSKKLTYYRLLAFLIYFVSIAWCIQAYNRSNRLVQLDKYDIAAKGRFVQFLFLLCLTVSRTLCIAYMASLFPLETLGVCILHVCFCGTVVFVLDSPAIAKSRMLNYIYCLTFGVVYIFIFTPVKDGPTKYKYTSYLTFCLLQNIIVCVLYIALYFSIAIIALYVCGILLTIYYYLYCHPSILCP
ncbi:XK-related protein 6 isoform X2 [Drosophila persimilis]|uniref:XK-related protein 6 isoform X2 n=1 Tax=Drosophila persimilis TaxID=7234 RepID=UPI000F083B26|nr:XK-related protein 6 isoform X2 [Drosophila persimilis]